MTNPDYEPFTQAMVIPSFTLHLAYLLFHGSKPKDEPPEIILAPIQQTAYSFRAANGILPAASGDLP